MSQSTALATSSNKVQDLKTTLLRCRYKETIDEEKLSAGDIPYLSSLCVHLVTFSKPANPWIDSVGFKPRSTPDSDFIDRLFTFAHNHFTIKTRLAGSSFLNPNYPVIFKLMWMIELGNSMITKHNEVVDALKEKETMQSTSPQKSQIPPKTSPIKQDDSFTRHSSTSWTGNSVQARKETNDQVSALTTRMDKLEKGLSSIQQDLASLMQIMLAQSKGSPMQENRSPMSRTQDNATEREKEEKKLKEEQERKKREDEDRRRREEQERRKRDDEKREERRKEEEKERKRREDEEKKRKDEEERQQREAELRREQRRAEREKELLALKQRELQLKSELENEKYSERSLSATRSPQHPNTSSPMANRTSSTPRSNTHTPSKYSNDAATMAAKSNISEWQNARELPVIDPVTKKAVFPDDRRYRSVVKASASQATVRPPSSPTPSRRSQASPPSTPSPPRSSSRNRAKDTTSFEGYAFQAETRHVPSVFHNPFSSTFGAASGSGLVGVGH